MMRTPELTAEELGWVKWQVALPGFGRECQQKLKNTTALVSRVGGVGSPAAAYLAMAGIGKLILAHGGQVEPAHMNRWPLVSTGQIRRMNPAIAVANRIRQLNPNVELMAVTDNITPGNAAGLVGQADIVVDGAPIFEERHLMNAECVRQGKPMVEATATGMDWVEPVGA